MSDNVYYTSDKIEIRKSPVHGLGVFAKQFIPKEETVEVCKLLKLGWRMAYQHDPIIKDYCWGNSGCKCDQCKMHGPSSYLALGFGSIYNHSDDPSIKLKFDYENQMFSAIAARDIEKDEELFVTYGDSYWKHRTHYLTKQNPSV